jgi:uncharacterized protein (DUF58 family)
MKLTERAYALSAFAALLTVLGAVLDLWFYTVGGITVALYIAWRYLAFDATTKKLALIIERQADKEVVSKDGNVTVTLGVTPNVNGTGVFSDVLPEGCDVVGGTNTLAVHLRKGERIPVTYTLRALKRADITIEHSTLTLENDLFAHTCSITSRPLELKQPVHALTIEGGPSEVIKEAMKAPVRELYRTRRIGTGFEFSHIRPYIPGDPLRKIHWKASARFDKLMTKEFFLDVTGELLEGHIALVIDQGAPMARGVPGHTELDFAVNIASYFVKFAVSKGSKVSLVTYNEDGVVHDIGLGDSQAHVTGIVKALNQLEPHSAFDAPSHKSGMTTRQARRIKKHFESAPDEDHSEDIRRFREIITYLYAREEGYQHYIQSSPAYKALHTAARRASNRATLVMLSDFESDLDPIMEGVKAAISRGLSVYLLAIFSKMFDLYDDPLIAVEEVYASYEEYKERLSTLRGISGARVVEANLIDYLEPALQAVKV